MANDRSVKSIIGSLERRSGLVIISALVATYLLAIPMTLMSNDEYASQDPAGEVFDLQDDINNRFEAPFHQSLVIAEARDGDILTQAAMWELYQNSQRLVEEDSQGLLAPDGLPQQPYLYTLYDPDTNRQTIGILGSMAYAVQQTLINDPRLNTTLERATNDQVKIAVHRVLSDPGSEGLKAFLAEDSLSERRIVSNEEIDYWTSPATIFGIFSDNKKLGGGTFQIGVGGGETIENKERFNRNVQGVLRGDQVHYRLWGVAIDVNLESADQGQIAGIFIMLTVIAAVLVMWISLRSYWAMALTGAGLGVLIVWLKGISVLIGLKGGLVIDLIVPIAMISLGVDFAVHAIRRYQEESRAGLKPGRALAVGLSGVMGALLLAMFSDSLAFLSNASSNIEAVIHFGIAAAIATASSFIILGIVVPLSLMRIDRMQSVASTSPSPGVQFLRLGSGISSAVLFGSAVILLIAVSKVLGLALLTVTGLLFLVVPAAFIYRKYRGDPDPAKIENVQVASSHRWLSATPVVEGLVTRLVKWTPAVLIAAALLTGLAIWLALKLEPTFDVEDFFDHSSDFVVSLDKLDTHVGTKAGEPGKIYIKGDLTDPAALSDIDNFITGLTKIPEVARFGDNEVMTGEHAISLIRDVTSNEFARSMVVRNSDVSITDSNGDGIPDTKDQVKAIYDFITEQGVPLNTETLRFNPSQVKQVLYHDPTGIEENVTILDVPIVGSREQANVASAEKALSTRLNALEANPAISVAGITGSPFTRDAQLRAATSTLQTSIPIAAAGAFLLLLIAMRSVRYAFVTIIPIGLVVTWLYGLMYVAGFALNFVTATIGAVSVGVGIDYSIHMTERFREELRHTSDRVQALRKAARNTGVALVASAASSIVGFTILGFAPMPMFASYGQLTAIMIFLALTASLVVLPPLLFLVTPSPNQAPD